MVQEHKFGTYSKRCVVQQETIRYIHSLEYVCKIGIKTVQSCTQYT